MSCLEFLGCLLQFMEYLSREKKIGECLRQRWGVWLYSGSLSFCLSQKPVRVHVLRHTCWGMNWFKVFTLCFSPETSLVSCRWEHPLGKLCSHTWFHICSPVSAWAQQGDSPCPGVWCGQEIPGGAHADLQTCWPWAAALQGPATSPCCKPCLCCPGCAPSQHRPQTSPLHPQFSRAFLQK